MDKKLNPVLLNIVEQRGVGADALEEFLSPKPQLTYDPFLLADMRAGVDLLLSEIDSGKQIVVYGDYDADGVTATTVMMKALSQLTDRVTYYIPSRIEEGYGLNKEAIDRINIDGGEVIITVDCGAVSAEETAYAKSLGITMIVTDHHNIADRMADGIVIDPRKPGDEYPFKGLAGVGVAYKFVQAISKERELPKSLITELLELVAVGTVADLMPLIDENRTIVKYGIRLMRLGCRNKGLRRLIELSGLDFQDMKASGISFGIAPRLNSAGRIGDASLGVRLLLSEDESEIEKCCQRLIELNRKRVSLQDEAYEQCIEKARKALAGSEDFVLIECENGHEGVLGIVAGKIKEEIYRPVVIVSETEDGYKGTGRSIPQVNLFEMLNKYRDRFIKFGGHSAACGFTLSRDRLDALREDLNRDLSELSFGNEDFFSEKIGYDAIIKPVEATRELVYALDLLEPCGIGNEPPGIAFKNVIINDWKYLKNGKKYAKLNISGIDCMLFKNAESYYDLYSSGARVTVIGSLRINKWNGFERVQMVIDKLFENKQ